MLVICDVDVSDAAELFGEPPPPAGMTPAQTALYLRRGLVAFGVEEDGQLAGLSIAASRPRSVHVLGMEGRTGACHLLLERLVRFAGERDLSAWCPASRPDVRHMLERRGFVKKRGGSFRGRPSFLYHWPRNEA